MTEKTKVNKKIKNPVTNRLNVLIQEILHFISISVKCILWKLSNEIVENHDLYRNKDDF